MKNKTLLPALAAFLLCLLTAATTVPHTASYDPNRPAPASTCELSAPASFEVQRTGGTTAALSWNAVGGAASYRLTVIENSGHSLFSDTVEYGTSKSLTGLTPGTTYRCVLASMCSGASTSNFVIIIDILD